MAKNRFPGIYFTKYSPEQQKYVGWYEQRLHPRSSIVYLQIIGIVYKFQWRRQYVGQAEYFCDCKSHLASSEVYLSWKVSKFILQNETIWKFNA